MVGTRQMVAITVGVRDARGLPLDDKASVRLISKASVYNRTIPTEGNSSATFPNVWEGPYDVEVKCEGYRPVLDHLDVGGGLAFFSTYIYLHPVNESVPSGGPAKGLVLTPKLATEIDKGLGSMHKQQYEAAKAHFVKAEKMVPSSSDVAYLIGTVELAMKQNEAARANFQKAVTLDPANDRAMVALGELQLQTGDAASAIVTLNQAYAANGAGWRTRYLLASAYAKTGKLRDAEMQAASAVKLARTNSATPLLLLGDIQAASGKWMEAKQSWNQILTECPNCPEANDARKRTAEASESHRGASNSHAGEFSHLAVAPELPPTIDDSPWAPPDVDSKEYSVATDVSCYCGEIIPRAMRRTKTQLG